MFRRYAILLLAFVSPICHAFAQGSHEEVLKSGHKIKVLGIQQIETKDAVGMGSALMLIYQTNLKHPDAVALRKEVSEVWNWIKADAEHRRLKDVIIGVVPPGDSEYRSQFEFKQLPDGSWKPAN